MSSDNFRVRYDIFRMDKFGNDNHYLFPAFLYFTKTFKKLTKLSTYSFIAGKRINIMYRYP